MRSAYRQIQTECKATVGRLLRDTDWLWQLERDPDCFEKMPREYLDAARYLTSPVISDDTLKLLVEGRTPAQVVLEFLDRERAPWLESMEEVDASHPDVRHAVDCTAKLWASQRSATELRNSQAKTQERRVRATLEAAGLRFVESAEIRQRIRALDDEVKLGLTPGNYQEILRRGEFTRETRVAGAKCDVPVRLRNGRLLPIECKVSGSATNGVKRLNRETGGKHDKWRGVFGTDLQAGAVLGGVFGSVSVRDAQNDGILIFFDHDLAALGRFIEAGTARS